MNYYAAPMEGLTDRVWRQAHQKWFGPAGNADRYYAPFISPPENRVLIKKKMAELAPAANPGAPVIPQLLAKDGELAAWMIGELRGLGYTEVNLNLGCPSGTVTAKGKGSGMLRDPVKLDAFLAAVFANAEGPISVKTRLGVEKPEEFAAILLRAGRPCRFCCRPARVPDARVLQRRCDHRCGPAHVGSAVSAAVRHHGGARHHCGPGALP